MLSAHFFPFVFIDAMSILCVNLTIMNISYLPYSTTLGCWRFQVFQKLFLQGLPTSEAQSFSPEQVKLFEQWFEERYDVPDLAYLAWKSANHPSPESVSSETSAANAATSSSTTSPVSVGGTKAQKKFLMNCSHYLKLRQLVQVGQRRRQSMIKL